MVHRCWQWRAGAIGRFFFHIKLAPSFPKNTSSLALTGVAHCCSPLQMTLPPLTAPFAKGGAYPLDGMNETPVIPADPPNLQKGVQKVTTTRNQTTQKSPSPRVPCTAARSKSNGRTSHKRRPSRPISHSDENHYDWVNSKRRVWGVQWTDAIGVLLKENEPGPRQHLRVEQRVRQLDGHA